MHSIIKSLQHGLNSIRLLENMQLLTRGYVKKVAVHEVPLDISPSSIKRALKAHNIPFDDGHACIAIQCTICAKLSKIPNESKVHINKTTGAFICACNYAGEWEEIRQSFSAKNMKCKSARDSKMLEDMSELETYLAKVKTETVIVNTLSNDLQSQIIRNFDLK